MLSNEVPGEAMRDAQETLEADRLRWEWTLVQQPVYLALSTLKILGFGGHFHIQQKSLKT